MVGKWTWMEVLASMDVGCQVEGRGSKPSKQEVSDAQWRKSKKNLGEEDPE